MEVMQEEVEEKAKEGGRGGGRGEGGGGDGLFHLQVTQHHRLSGQERLVPLQVLSIRRRRIT